MSEFFYIISVFRIANLFQIRCLAYLLQCKTNYTIFKSKPVESGKCGHTPVVDIFLDLVFWSGSQGGKMKLREGPQTIQLGWIINSIVLILKTSFGLQKVLLNSSSWIFFILTNPMRDWLFMQWRTERHVSGFFKLRSIQASKGSLLPFNRLQISD